MLGGLLAVGFGLTGCGEDDGATFSMDGHRAAAATAQQGTARLDMTLRMSGLGLPGELEVTAEGVTALGEPRADITMDFGNLLGVLGAGDGDGKVRILFGSGRLYVDPPAFEGIELPNDGGWIGIDLRQAVEALGIDADAASALFTVDPASQLRALREAGALEEVGPEEIDGARTTHLKGAYSIDDVVASLPADRRDRVRRALDDFAKLAGPAASPTDQDVPVEVWVGEDAIVRRMRTEAALPAQPGVRAGKMSVTYELSDFGAPLDVSAPRGAEDITDRVLRALRQAPGLLGGGGAAAG